MEHEPTRHWRIYPKSLEATPRPDFRVTRAKSQETREELGIWLLSASVPLWLWEADAGLPASAVISGDTSAAPHVVPRPLDLWTPSAAA